MATSALAVQNWFETTLTSGITDSTSTIDLNNLPSGTEGFLVIEPDSEANREVIYYTNKTGSAVTGVTRGRGGTSAIAHSQGATVRMQVVDEYWEALQDGTALATGAITAAKIGADAVTAPKIDWASTGADGGIWWEELGRHTLSGAGDTMTVSSLPVRKHLKILVCIVASGAISPELRFNNDSTTANYNRRVSDNHGATATSAGAALFFATGAATGNSYSEMQVLNIAAQNKIIMSHSIADAGDGVAPTSRELLAQWENNTDAITRIDVVNADSGDMATGSELIILGHD